MRTCRPDGAAREGPPMPIVTVSGELRAARPKFFRRFFYPGSPVERRRRRCAALHAPARRRGRRRRPGTQFPPYGLREPQTRARRSLRNRIYATMPYRLRAFHSTVHGIGAVIRFARLYPAGVEMRKRPRAGGSSGCLSTGGKRQHSLPNNQERSSAGRIGVVEARQTRGGVCAGALPKDAESSSLPLALVPPP